jgi:hypothetical protein
MNEEDNRFKAWLEDRHPQVKLLLDEEVSTGVSISSGAASAGFVTPRLRVRCENVIRASSTNTIHEDS